eukprot:EG_transcript_11441
MERHHHLSAVTGTSLGDAAARLRKFGMFAFAGAAMVLCASLHSTAHSEHPLQRPPPSCPTQPLGPGLRVLLLVNPFAGKGKGTQAAHEVDAALTQAGLIVDVFQSTRPGDLHRQARHFDLTHYSIIAIVGGDGSIHEVLNGMLSRPDGLRRPLALVPCGTGNALAASFASTQRTPRQCAESILQGHIHMVDFIVVRAGAEEVKSFNVINWPADYAPRAEAMRWLGPRRYSAAVALDILGGRRARRVRLRVDDEELVDEVMLVHIQNTKTCGNQLLAAPEARVDDGLLDMFYVRDCGKPALLRLLTQVRTGGHVNNPNAVFRRCKRLSVEPLEGPPSLVMVDGEICGTDPLTLEVLPAAFSVIV